MTVALVTWKLTESEGPHRPDAAENADAKWPPSFLRNRQNIDLL